MKISYAITVKDELEDIKRLVTLIQQYRRQEDEIVIVYDSNNGSKEVIDFVTTLSLSNYKFSNFFFDNDFSALKNYLISKCSGDYIFNIDADEYITEIQNKNIIETLVNNPTFDVIMLPRINLLTGNVTEEHIKEFNFNLNEKGWINFPDYQPRIFKNSPNIKWINKVHEQLIGSTRTGKLSPQEQFSIMHVKTIEKMWKQHMYYKEKFYNKEK